MKEYYDALSKVLEYVGGRLKSAEQEQDYSKASHWQGKYLALLIIKGEMLKDEFKEEV